MASTIGADEFVAGRARRGRCGAAAVGDVGDGGGGRSPVALVVQLVGGGALAVPVVLAAVAGVVVGLVAVWRSRCSTARSGFRPIWLG